MNLQPSLITCIQLNVHSILCAGCLLGNAEAKCMRSCKWTDTFECLRWGSDRGCWYLHIRKRGIMDVVLCGPYKGIEVLNKGEKVSWTSLPPSTGCAFQSQQQKTLHPSRETASLGVPDATCQE